MARELDDSRLTVFVRAAIHKAEGLGAYTLAHRRTAIAGLVLAALAYLVWPTPYRYVAYGTTTARISRLTGHADVLTRDGWIPLQPADAWMESWLREEKKKDRAR